MGEKWPKNFAWNARLPCSIQWYFTCHKSTTLDRRLYFPSEGRRAEDFFEAVSLTHRLSSSTRKHSWYSFLLEVEKSTLQVEFVIRKPVEQTAMWHFGNCQTDIIKKLFFVSLRARSGWPYLLRTPATHSYADSLIPHKIACLQYTRRYVCGYRVHSHYCVLLGLASIVLLVPSVFINSALASFPEYIV
jgi:hypothetical protein